MNKTAAAAAAVAQNTATVRAFFWSCWEGNGTRPPPIYPRPSEAASHWPPLGHNNTNNFVLPHPCLRLAELVFSQQRHLLQRASEAGINKRVDL